MGTWARAGGCAGSNYTFLTHKERDIETGLDYFLARYYSSTQGRFTSPDEFKGGPEELFGEVDPHDPLFYAEIAEPQSLNKYHYALNNPLRYIDPDGHQTVAADKIWQGLKALARGGVDTQIAVDKIAANLVIGASNIGNGAIGGQQIAPFEPSGKVQEISMRALEVGILFSPLAGKGGPANVVVAESKQTTVVAGEVANQSTTTVLRGTKQNGGITQPNAAPTGTIVNEKGVKIQRNTNDHAPPHLHVSGKGPHTRIGQNGRPLKNNPALSGIQGQVVEANLGTIRKTVRQVMKEHRYNSQ